MSSAGAGEVLALLEVLRGLVEGITDLEAARARIATAARDGDLDRVIAWAQQRDARVREFLEEG